MFLKLFPRYAGRARRGATVAGDHLRGTAVVVENAPPSRSRDTMGPASFALAGFDDFRWVDAMLEPTERDDPYWDDFLTHAPLTAFSASKR